MKVTMQDIDTLVEKSYIPDKERAVVKDALYDALNRINSPQPFDMWAIYDEGCVVGIRRASHDAHVEAGRVSPTARVVRGKFTPYR